MKTKIFLPIVLLTLSISGINAQNSTIEATVQNLTKHPVIAFRIDQLTVQGMTEKDTLFIKNAQNFVFKKDDKEEKIGGYQVFLESAFRHPIFNVNAVIHHFYDGDSLIFDVYSLKEVSRTITPKEKLKPFNLSFIRGALPTLLNILQSKGFRTTLKKDTLLNGKTYLYIKALPEADTINHELLIDKQQNLPYFLRITTNIFQPFIDEFTYSSFAYLDSFEKPQSMLQPIQGTTLNAPPLAVGDFVPDWDLRLLSGEPFSFRKLAGKKTILYVSMINCGPCQSAIPFVQELIEKYKADPDVQVVVFYPYDSKTNLDKYVKTKQISYPIVYNSKENENERVEIINRMEMGMPTFLLLDKNKKISGRILGFNNNEKGKIEKLIEEKLNEIPLSR